MIPLEGRRGSRAAEWIELGLRAGLAVPIMAGSDAVGVLEFFADEPFPADPELLELLLSVGTQLGRVVERQRSEEARLRALIDNMPANVYLRDLNGRFILVNRQYEEFWGLRHDEIRGKTLFEVDAMTECRREARGERAGRPRGAGGRRAAPARDADRPRGQGARPRRCEIPGAGQLGPDRGRRRHRHRHHRAEAERGRAGRAAAARGDGPRRGDGSRRPRRAGSSRT